jgi:hypothetical protein
MQPPLHGKPSTRAAAAASPAASTSSSASAPFSRCHAFASILRSAGIPSERAFADLWVCSLANQILPEVSRPMLSILMQSPHAFLPEQVAPACACSNRSHTQPRHCRCVSPAVQKLLSIFSAPEAGDLKDALRQLQHLGIVVAGAASGSGSGVCISPGFHASMDAFCKELPASPLRPLRRLSAEDTAAVASWAQKVTGACAICKSRQRSPPHILFPCSVPTVATFLRTRVLVSQRKAACRRQKKGGSRPRPRQLSPPQPHQIWQR